MLGLAIIFESVSFYFAFKAFRKEMGRKGVLQTIHASKDPTTFTILFEDSAALLGLLVAFVGIFLGHALNNPYLDGVASIAIGVILGVVAGFLAYESKGLLIGEGVDAETLRRLRAIVLTDPAVEHVNRLLTIYFGPREVMLALEVKFRDELSGKEIRLAVARLQTTVRKEYPDITRIFFGSESLVESQNPDSVKDR